MNLREKNPRLAENLKKYKRKQIPKNTDVLQFKICMKQEKQLRACLVLFIFSIVRIRSLSKRIAKV